MGRATNGANTQNAILSACGVPTTTLTGSSKITAVGHLETRWATHSSRSHLPTGCSNCQGLHRLGNPHRVPDGIVLDRLVQECDERDEQADASDRPPVSRQQLPQQPAAASGAATLGSLGPFPFTHWGLWGPSLLCSTHAGSRVPHCEAVRSRSLWVASPGSESSPESHGRFLGRRPFVRSTIARRRHWSPKGGSQRACPLGVPTPRLPGDEKEWRSLSSCFGR